MTTPNGMENGNSFAKARRLMANRRVKDFGILRCIKNMSLLTFD